MGEDAEKHTEDQEEAARRSRDSARRQTGQAWTAEGQRHPQTVSSGAARGHRRLQVSQTGLIIAEPGRCAMFHAFALCSLPTDHSADVGSAPPNVPRPAFVVVVMLQQRSQLALTPSQRSLRHGDGHCFSVLHAAARSGERKETLGGQKRAQRPGGAATGNPCWGRSEALARIRCTLGASITHQKIHPPPITTEHAPRTLVGCPVLLSCAGCAGLWNRGSSSRSIDEPPPWPSAASKSNTSQRRRAHQYCAKAAASSRLLPGAGGVSASGFQSLRAATQGAAQLHSAEKSTHAHAATTACMADEKLLAVWKENRRAVANHDRALRVISSWPWCMQRLCSCCNPCPVTILLHRDRSWSVSYAGHGTVLRDVESQLRHVLSTTSTTACKIMEVSEADSGTPTSSGADPSRCLFKTAQMPPLFLRNLCADIDLPARATSHESAVSSCLGSRCATSPASPFLAVCNPC